MLAGVVVTTQLGRRSAIVFYLAVYLLDEPRGVRGDRGARARDRRWATTSPRCTGSARPAAARLADDDRDALAGRLPGDGGLLREGLPDRAPRSTTTTPGSAWSIVIGSAISLAYYLRVVAAVWMRAPDEATAGERGGRVALRRRARPAIAGGSAEADRPGRRGATTRAARAPTRRLRAARGRRARASSARRRRSSSGSTRSPLLDVAQRRRRGVHRTWLLAPRGETSPRGRPIASGCDPAMPEASRRPGRGRVRRASCSWPAAPCSRAPPAVAVGASPGVARPRSRRRRSRVPASASSAATCARRRTPRPPASPRA